MRIYFCKTYLFKQNNNFVDLSEVIGFKIH